MRLDWKNALAALVDTSIRHARIVLGAGLLTGILSAAYVVNAFEVRTDLDSLLSTNLPWRRDALELERAFPSQGDDITLVIDAVTPERARAVADALVERLEPRADLFASIDRYNGGAFFDREGLLFLSVAEVTDITSSLIRAQPLLGPLAADPSLRGLMTSLDTGLGQVESDPTRIQDLLAPMRAVDRVLAARERGEPSFLSWSNLVSDTARPEDWRQYIEIIPHLDYSSTAPAAPAIAAIRAAARDLTSPENGVVLRISGSAPIADEELATLGESTGPIAALMLACVIGILYFAIRSKRMIGAILLTVTIGAALTSAVGLLLFQSFNLISVAFLPLFVGLGIDFAIQFSVRARAEAALETDLREMLKATARNIGGALLLATAAVAAAFFAFSPTTYRGVAELGVIAGIGMPIAVLLTLTFLPAALRTFGVGQGAREKGLSFLRGADRNVRRATWPILVVTLLAAIFGAASLPMLHFNFDPMRLRDPRTEAMSTYLELSRSTDTTPNTLNILSPNLATANAVAAQLVRLPEIADATTISAFAPTEQDAKLALITDAQMLLGPSLDPFDIAPPPSDAEDVACMRAMVGRMRGIANLSPQDTRALHSLAARLEHLALDAPSVRAEKRDAILSGLPVALAQFNTLLSAEPLTVEALPASLRRQWLDAQGRARIEVSPSGALRTREETAAFVAAVRRVAPDASGDAATVVEAGRTIMTAFLQAGALSTLVIGAILFLALKRAVLVALTIGPVLLSGLFTFATCALLGLDINLENMIALPLLLGIGVAFNIYFVIARRDGETEPLGTSLARGVFFSAATTGAAFAALGLSAHPGTASMGVLLMIALFWILVTTLIVLPALFNVVLGSPATMTQRNAAVEVSSR